MAAKMKTGKLIDEILSKLKQKNADTIIVGPVVLDEDDKPYFMLAGGIRQGSAELAKIGFRDDTLEKARRLRDGVVGTLLVQMTKRKPPGFIHIMDDELQMARIGEAYWPERFAPILRSIEQGRGVTP